MRIIQINGVRGLLIAFFALSCLIAGFVAFPSFMLMSAWNYLAETTQSFPLITFAQGVLLWAIIAFSFYLFTNRKFIVSVDPKPELSESEVKQIMENIKIQAERKQKMIDKKFELEKNKIEQEKQEISAEKRD